jgi:hypothetical protein
MTQRQEFKVLQKYDDFELREYAPCVVAEVKNSGQYSNATSSAFGSLFRYISKGNQASEKIVMTAPVIAAQDQNSINQDQWSVSFVMPAGSKLQEMPQPTDPHVKLREINKEKCVSISFRGRATEELANKKINQLRASAAKQNIALSNETRICRFDPPFKPGLLHYNEIVIPVL